MASNQDLKIISYNINGILNPAKRSKILSKMKKENAQIVFLQETHLNAAENEKLKRMGFSKVYYSYYRTGHRRGVAILISHKIPFELTSEIKDKEGRYILISGNIDGNPITLLNVYAPPGSDFDFYRKMFDLMTDTTGLVITGGDWNIRLHRSDSSKPFIQTSLHKKFRILMTDLGIIDLWRDFYPTGRDYTHYSHPHALYSRIDYFFIFKKDRHRVRLCEIGNIDLSDHAPLSLSLQISNNPRNTLWRINSSILNNLQFKTQTKAEIKQFLEENDNGDVGPELVWDTLKAVFRGKIISYCASKKKERQLLLIELNRKLKELEAKHKEEQTPSLHLQLRETRNQINIIYSREIEKKMIFTKQRYYESGSKFSKLLARKLKQQQADNTIYKIRDPDSKNIVYKQSDIQRSFQKFYTKLYTQPPLKEDQQIDQFLDSLNLSTLTEDQSNKMIARITEEEVNDAISRLKANKTPGPDGYSSEWFKTFRLELIPSLIKLFNEVLKNGKTPPSWKEATISVIPKEGKDSLDCGSYRPISILNIDYKIYTSILARRVEGVLFSLIGTDQTGFIPQRTTHDNIRRSLHILSHVQEHKLPAALVSLDCEKAFDSVSWRFLFKVLKKMGFHEEFIKGINTLYNNSVARVKINGYLSEKIQLERGTKQGCGLSPALFAIFIEPLAQWIRQSDNIKGISIKGDQHKSALFADDVLIFLSQPSDSLPELFKLLNEFGTYSGYKLNVQKTQILTLNYLPTRQIQDKFNLKWGQTTLKYLGIMLPKDISTLAKVNYDPLLSKIKSDIQRWNTNPWLSLSQRVESIKMNILPRLLYLFQALPVEISTKQFSEWNKIISRFIWQGKKPRIRFKTMQLTKEDGGMAVPNLKDYYYSAQLRPLTLLCNPEYSARWKDIEVSLIKDPPITAILGNDNLSKFINTVKNPWLKFQIKVWKSVRDEYHLQNKTKVIRWCAYDTDFKPNQLDSRFKFWSTKGITTFYSIIEKGQLKDFQTLKRKYDLERQDFYRYLQLRSYFDQHIKHTLELEDPVLRVFLQAYSSESYSGVISRLYSGFMAKKPHSTEYVKNKWENEGNFEMSKEEWTGCLASQWKCTNSHSWREFAWKCLVRFFITPKQKTHFAGEDAKCWRLCGNQNANHWHIFWDCPVIRPYWTEIHKALEIIFKVKIPFQFEIFILGKTDFHAGHFNEYLFHILLLACKKNITKHWLLIDPLKLEDWACIVNDIYIMEKITFSLRLRF